MNKRQEKGVSQQKLATMTLSQRQTVQRDAERVRLGIVREIENLLVDMSKIKKGRAFKLKNLKQLGHRPNDIVEE